VLVHEVAHMWFYGMVGNSQFRDPWLDEAFATWAEVVVDEQSASGYRGALQMPGDVGGSMADFTDDATYFHIVYGKGGAALLAAREAAGPEAFDAAIRCYADANAWSIATPEDVAAALADLPGAIAVLTDAQALGQVDLPR
ncbi:MAG TPA: M1 family aminopeptidase, partial [Blastococcus sp.]